MKAILKISAVVLITLFFASCKKDKENPAIVISEPENHSQFYWGDEVHVRATFSDDRNLASYHIYIGTETGEDTPGFDAGFANIIEGKTYAFHEHFIVPDSIEMVYYLHFEVTDAAGKSSTEKLMLHFEE